VLTPYKPKIEALVDMAGKRIRVQLFILRLIYSHARFVMAFPFQKQEAFSKTTFRHSASSECPAGSPTTT
jgi:hypothetical protein